MILASSREDAFTLIARLLKRAARRPTEAQVGDREKRKSWFEFRILPPVSSFTVIPFLGKARRRKRGRKFGTAERHR